MSCLAGDLLRLDEAGKAWDVVGRLRHPRFFHRLVPAGATGLIAIGGEGGDAKHDDLEVLNPAVAPGPIFNRDENSGPER